MVNSLGYTVLKQMLHHLCIVMVFNVSIQIQTPSETDVGQQPVETNDNTAILNRNLDPQFPDKLPSKIYQKQPEDTKVSNNLLWGRWQYVSNINIVAVILQVISNILYQVFEMKPVTVKRLLAKLTALEGNY